MEILTENKFSFAEFELDASRRLLYKAGKPVALHARTLDLLLFLVMRRGEILSKDELLKSVWKGQFVEEGNLTVHISNLRKILGEKKDENRFIVTVPGRGYKFIAALNELNKDDFDEIIFESHSVARIMVQEDQSDPGSNLDVRIHSSVPDPKIDEQLIPQHKSRGLSSMTRLLLTALLIVVVLLLGIGIYLIQSNSGKKSSSKFQQMSLKRLTNSGNVNRAALSPDGKLFVYSVQEGERESLWLGHADGGEPVQVVPPSNQIYLNIKFTPDGSCIYYTISENYGRGSLYKMPVFGGVAEKIRDNLNNFTFAPDSQRFAFLSYEESRKKVAISTADAEGKNEREIAVLPNNLTSKWHSISWSPDGSMIALAATIKDDNDVELFIVNTSDGSIKSLTTKVWSRLDGINWLHDNSGLIVLGKTNDSILPQLWHISFPAAEVSRISNDLSDYGYFVSLANDNTMLIAQGVSQSNIWVAPASKLQDSKQITFGSAGRQDGWFGLVWTRDGRIIYTANSTSGTTLWIMNGDGSGKPKQLIPNGGVNSYPSLSADNQTLIFESNRSGRFGVWRADLDGGNMKLLTGDQAAVQPFISPDGNWILYSSNIDSAGELWRIPVAGGEPFRLIDKSAGWASISPDSKFVVSEIKDGSKIKLGILSLETGELQKTFEIPRLANTRLGIHWTPDGKAIAYRDWANGIWKQNIDGGEPHRLDGLPEEKLFCFDWSPDGKYFAYTRGMTSRDVVLISDVK